MREGHCWLYDYAFVLNVRITIKVEKMTVRGMELLLSVTRFNPKASGQHSFSNKGSKSSYGLPSSESNEILGIKI